MNCLGGYELWYRPVKIICPHDTTNGCLWSESNSLVGYTTRSWKLSPCKRWSLGMGRIAHLSLLFIRKCWWWKHMPHSVLFWNIWLHHKHWMEAHFASISLQSSLWPQLSYILFPCCILSTQSLFRWNDLYGWRCIFTCSVDTGVVSWLHILSWQPFYLLFGHWSGILASSFQLFFRAVLISSWRFQPLSFPWLSLIGWMLLNLYCCWPEVDPEMGW